MRFPETLLVTWSLIANLWWFAAILLVALPRRRTRPDPNRTFPSLTLFKPLPPVLSASSLPWLAQAVESFVAQLDDSTELLLGIPAEQVSIWQPWLDEWRRKFPHAQLISVSVPAPRQQANPKVAWMEILAPQARGERWMWSDADITAPPGFLRTLRQELESSTAGAVTAVYCIRSVRASPGMVDALFVNTDFLPGALLLGWLGPAKLSFGSAVLFRAAEFRQKVVWTDLGACLADDYALGQRLHPVHLSAERVETCALQENWTQALRHLHRWQKTIRWCQPGSFAALILILPLFGWLIRCGWAPQDPVAWMGLGLQYAAEAGAATVILGLVGFRQFGRFGWMILLWPLLRLLGWLSAWLPWAVVWEEPGQTWSRPHHPATEPRRRSSPLASDLPRP